jgi:hypothetical protein
LKVFHIAFSYWSPMPGVITLAAETPEAATEQLMELAKDMRDVKVHQVLDTEQLPVHARPQTPADNAVDDELLTYNNPNTDKIN